MYVNSLNNIIIAVQEHLHGSSQLHRQQVDLEEAQEEQLYMHWPADSSMHSYTNLLSRAGHSRHDVRELNWLVSWLSDRYLIGWLAGRTWECGCSLQSEGTAARSWARYLLLYLTLPGRWSTQIHMHHTKCSQLVVHGKSGLQEEECIKYQTGAEEENPPWCSQGSHSIWSLFGNHKDD